MAANTRKTRYFTKSTATDSQQNCKKIKILSRHHSNSSSAALFANRIVYGTVVLLLLVAPLGKFLSTVVKFQTFNIINLLQTPIESFFKILQSRNEFPYIISAKIYSLENFL